MACPSVATGSQFSLMLISFTVLSVRVTKAQPEFERWPLQSTRAGLETNWPLSVLPIRPTSCFHAGGEDCS